MTLAQLERIVLILANQGYCRYWKHWNYPERSPWVMAVSSSDKILESDMINRGFQKLEREGKIYWLIERAFEQ